MNENELPAANENPDVESAEPSAGQEAAARRPVLVRFHESDSGLKCIFRGRMDTVNAQAVEKELVERLDEARGKRVVFELSAVDYLASAFLRLCVMGAKKSAGDFAIVNPSQNALKVLRVAGMESLVRRDC